MFRSLPTLVVVGLFGAFLVSSTVTAGGVSVVGLLSNELPLYEPETLNELKRLRSDAVRSPIPVKLNEIGMYEALIGGVRYWINPADVVTSDSKELQKRCMASAGKIGGSTSARAFGSGCQ